MVDDSHSYSILATGPSNIHSQHDQKKITLERVRLIRVQLRKAHTATEERRRRFRHAVD